MNNLKFTLIKKYIIKIYNNKLLLNSYKLDSNEFDDLNDEISYLYKKVKQLSKLSFIQIDRILNNLHKHETKC